MKDKKERGNFMKTRVSMIVFVTLLMVLLPSFVWAAEENSIDVATAQEFVQAVADGEKKINLTADMDLTGAGVLDVDGCIINLNKHTISASNFTLFFQGSNVMIKNGTFDSKGESYAIFIGDNGTTNHFILQDITTKGGINIFNAVDVRLRNVHATGTSYYAVWCDENGKAVIESGTYKSNSTVAVLGLTTVDSELRITGGNFITNNNKPLVLKNGDQYGKPVISGGKFDCAVAKEYCKEGFELIAGSDGSYGVCNHAQIKIKNQTEATYEKEGYTGDSYCATCNKLLKQGTVIPVLERTTAQETPVKENQAMAGEVINATSKVSSETKQDKEEKKEQEETKQEEKDSQPNIPNDALTTIDQIETHTQVEKKDDQQKENSIPQIIFFVILFAILGFGIWMILVKKKRKHE